jgi:hypothetical protein
MKLVQPLKSENTSHMKSDKEKHTEKRFGIRDQKTNKFLKFETNFTQMDGADIKCLWVDRIQDAILYRAKNYLYDDIEFAMHTAPEGLEVIEVEKTYEIKSAKPLNLEQV